jgi:RNA polymerase sigma factor (sigma-70 family)
MSTASRPTVPAPEELYRQNLGMIQEIHQCLCRKKRVPPEEAKDLASEIHLKLIDDDYRVLRQWNQRSQLRTYLASVVACVWCDHVRQIKGRNRPSASARGSGPLAEKLEALLGEGHSVDGAYEQLRPYFPELTRDQVEKLAIEVKPKTRPWFDGDEEAIADLPASEPDGEVRIAQKEGIALKRKALSLMGELLAELPEQDRVLLVSAHAASIKVSRIAKSLGLVQKPLYRRIDKRLDELKRKLEAAGVRWEQLREVLGSDGPE